MTAVDDAAPVRRKRAKRRRDPLGHSQRSPAEKARTRGEPCKRCGKQHVDSKGNRTCNGHRKHVRPYQPCTRTPVKGAAVCPMHGGNNSVVRQRAEMRIAWEQTEGEVAALLRECDLPEQHPIDGLLEVVRHSGAMMRLLASMVAQLDLSPGEVRISFNEKGDARKYTYSEDGIYGYNSSGDQATHVLVQMYGQWSDRYARACKLALDANIDERLVRNAEATSNVVFLAIEQALKKADLSPDQSAAFSKTLADELRKLASPLEGRQA